MARKDFHRDVVMVCNVIGSVVVLFSLEYSLDMLLRRAGVKEGSGEKRWIVFVTCLLPDRVG